VRLVTQAVEVSVCEGNVKIKMRKIYLTVVKTHWDFEVETRAQGVYGIIDGV
jgi:hypothetical protein